MEATSAHQCNVLLLLVGGNPLPNAVAASWLAPTPPEEKPKRRVVLVYSGASGEICTRLEAWLQARGLEAERCEVKESRPNSIMNGVESALEKHGASGRVGLNYTGGTKAMAVHAYRAVEQWAEKSGAQPVFSYLDARTLRMVFGPDEHREFVGPHVRITLVDLLALHGWELWFAPPKRPIFARTAREIAAVYSQGGQPLDAWSKWIDTYNLRSSLDNGVLEQALLRLPTDPGLGDFAGALQSDLSLGGQEFSLIQAIFQTDADNEVTQRSQGSNRSPAPPAGWAREFQKWLTSQWLEHHTLDCLLELGEEELHVAYRNVQTRGPDFEVDVVALRGYQLFVFSCSITGKKAELKRKLFEVYVRARQLGGTEAGIALVTGSDDPDTVQTEARREVDDRRIKAFGRKHLEDLGKHLRGWILTESDEE